MLKELLNIVESSDYKAPDSPWVHEGNTIKRTLLVDGEPIITSIEPKTITINDRSISFLNLAFSAIDDHGNPTSKPTNKNVAIFKIISASFNAFIDKINDFEYNILTFVALDKIDTRISIYNKIIQKNLSKFGDSKISDIKLNNGGKAIIIFKDINDKTKNEFIEWLKTRDKISFTESSRKLKLHEVTGSSEDAYVWMDRIKKERESN